MLDSTATAEALRAGVRLRDKLIVLAVDAVHASRDPARLDAMAADLALARALGARVLAVVAAGEGSQPLDAQRPALRLLSALERHGERGVALPAAGLVTVHRLPLAAAAAAAAGVPTMIPVVNTTVLLHLLALGHVPVLFAPAVDAEGAAIDLGVGTLAAFMAQFMSAALLLLPPDGPPVEVPGGGLPPLPPIVVTDAASPGRLIADVLHHAQKMPVPPPSVVVSNAALPLNSAPR